MTLLFAHHSRYTNCTCIHQGIYNTAAPLRYPSNAHGNPFTLRTTNSRRKNITGIRYRRALGEHARAAAAPFLPPTVPPSCCGTPVFWITPAQVDPGVDFWTEEEIAEEQRLYGKDEANETLEKLFQVIRRGGGAA